MSLKAGCGFVKHFGLKSLLSYSALIGLEFGQSVPIVQFDTDKKIQSSQITQSIQECRVLHET